MMVRLPKFGRTDGSDWSHSGTDFTGVIICPFLHTKGLVIYGVHHLHSQWNIFFSRNFREEEYEDFLKLSAILHNLQMERGVADKRRWRWELGLFMVSSACRWLMQGGWKVNWGKRVWNKNIPINCQHVID